jgi:AmmeMemoRadiSam system protein A
MNLVELAKKTVETYIKKGKIISSPDDLPKEFLERKAGTFVTIEKNGNLRGCIGTYLPTRRHIAEEIIYNSIAAATEDYRFGSIQKEELPYLSYTVYILSEPELVKDLKDPTKFSEEKFRRAGLDPKKYGIIVKTVPITPSGDVVFDGHFIPKTGLLLPDLEGIDTIEQQISIACQKGEIDPLKEKISIYKFTVEKYQ